MADALLDNARASFEEASAQHPGYGIDVVLGLGYLEADTIVHARLGPASVRDPDVVWRVRRALAHGFLLGELHEPAMLLARDLVATGPLEQNLGLLPLLPSVSRRYAEASGVQTREPQRLPVLRRFAPSVGARLATLTRSGLGPSPTDQAVVAAGLLLGFHPLCRRVEVGHVVAERGRGAIGDRAFDAFFATLAAGAAPAGRTVLSGASALIASHADP